LVFLFVCFNFFERETTMQLIRFSFFLFLSLYVQVVGDQDPYAPLHVQQELFTNLGRGTDRTWSILSDADHAVHLLEGRSRFQGLVTSFIMNGKKIGKEIVC